MFFFKILNIYNIKGLKVGLSNTGGRINKGCIVSYNKGGGLKRRLFIIDFFRNYNSFGIVLKILKDKKRTGFVALVYIFIKKLVYILIAKNVKKGDLIYLGSNILQFWYILKKWKIIDDVLIQFNSMSLFFFKKILLFLGNTIPLKFIPKKSLVYNISLNPCKNEGILVRSAGVSGLILRKFKNKVEVKLRSNFCYFLFYYCMASIGVVSNSNHNKILLKKAGNKVNLGFRPKVRGVAMNPIDHPHGGGEGRTSGGKPSVTPWGYCTKGKKTVLKKYRMLKKYKYYRR